MRGEEENRMLSPCTGEALSEACCHGCCSNPFHGLAFDHHHHSHALEAPKSPSTAAAARHEFKVTTTCCLFPNAQFTNHESLPPLHESFANFTKVFPQYLQTDRADQIRAQDYFHLSLNSHVCFDYIGHGLFSYSQLQSCSSNVQSSVASTSSSPPPPSVRLEPPFFDICYRSVNLNSLMQYGGEESELESKISKRIMDFMNISEDDYTLVFTANQSSAFKLLAESYPFHSNPRLLTVYDHENEAAALMIESSKKRGARVSSAEFAWPNLRIHPGKLMKKIAGKKKKKKKKGLFVFPIQSKVTGARYSYTWMSAAEDKGWHVLLDATALGSKDMDTLGLSLFKPDFLICSFYKIFGENPSGFGCFFVKKSSASVLRDSTSSVATTMGIVSLVPPTRQSVVEPQRDDLAATVSTSELRQEPSFSEIIELETLDESSQSKIPECSISGEIECKGLDHADALGLILISNRARYLINWLANALMNLHHPYSETRIPLIRIYGPKVKFDRGPSLAFNVFDWNGTKIEPALVQKLADRYNISLSCGFLQNIFFSDKYEQERVRVLEKRSATNETQSGISVVTAALGCLTNFEDTYRLWEFVSRFLDADFVEKERWRYMALNQKTIEI